MPYMHQLPLVQAYKRLYMLGSSSAKKQKQSDLGDLGSSVVGGVKRSSLNRADARAKANLAADAKMKQESADAAQMEDDVRYIKEGPEAFQEFKAVQSGQAIPTNPYAAELDRQNTDKAAMEAPVNGVYSHSGLQKASRDADLNGRDRLFMRGLVAGQQLPPEYGLGGSRMGY